jgi:hypothetical protein
MVGEVVLELAMDTGVFLSLLDVLTCNEGAPLRCREVLWDIAVCIATSIDIQTVQNVTTRKDDTRPLLKSLDDFMMALLMMVGDVMFVPARETDSVALCTSPVLGRKARS